MEFKTPLKLPPRFHYKTDHFNSHLSQKTPPLSLPNAPRTASELLERVSGMTISTLSYRLCGKQWKKQEEQTAIKYKQNRAIIITGASDSRWVRAQIKEGGLGPKGSVFRLRGPIFRQSTRFVKIKLGKFVADKCRSVVNGESKVKKLKGIFQRYASFGREDNKRVNQDRFGGSR